MFRLAWRLQRAGLIGMSALGVFYGFIQAAAYKSAAGATSASRIAFGHQMESFGRTLTFLLPRPVRLDTVAGYVQWRIYGGLATVFAIWALMAGVGATRGDEDRGLVEQWLSSSLGPARYVGTRCVAFVLAAAIVVAAPSTTIYLVIIRSGFSLNPGAVVEESIALLALLVTCYAIVLVLAQLASRRATALGTAGAVLAVVYFINSFSRTDETLRPMARLISPFYYLDRSMPLTPGGSFDLGGTVGLFMAAVTLAALAAWFMRVRDIGAPLLRLRRHEHAAIRLPSRSPLLRTPVLWSVYEQRQALLVWTVGAAIGAAYIASIGRPLVDVVKGPGRLRAYLTLAGHGNPYVVLTGYFWFGIFQLVLVAFALACVARWSSDDNDGRLEMQLSAPVSRWRVVVERALSFLVSVIVIVAASSTAFYLSASASNIGLHLGDLFVASLAVLPFVLSFAALGAVLTSRVPRAAITVLAAVAFLSYLITQGGPLLKWPDWVMKLSAFSLYGTPLTNGVYWTGLWILSAVSVLGFGVATMWMQRREVGR